MDHVAEFSLCLTCTGLVSLRRRNAAMSQYLIDNSVNVYETIGHDKFVELSTAFYKR